MEGPSPRPRPGLLVRDSIGPDGKPRAQIRYGEAGERLLAGMRSAVHALLGTGNDVIVDEMPINTSILPSWRAEPRMGASRFIGHSPGAGRVLTVIAFRDEDGDLHLINAWPATGADVRIY